MNENKFTKSNLILITIIAVVVICIIAFVIITMSNNKKSEPTNIVQENVVINEVNEQNAKAKINNKYFLTLQEAIDNVIEGETDTKIELLKNTNENIIVSENKNIALELNNNKVKNVDKTKSTIIVKGNLTINNGEISGDMNALVPTIFIEANSKLKSSNTNITRESVNEYAKETISVHGNLDIDSGKITNNNSNTIYTYTERYAEVNISGTAEILSVDHPAIFNRNEVKINISGGKIYSENNDSINNQNGGQIIVSGGSVTSKTGRPVNNYGILEVSDSAKISSTNQPTIYNQSGSNLKVSGGEIFSETAITIMNQNNAVLEITGGKISSETGNAINNSGTLKISDNSNILSNGEQSPTIYNNKDGNVEILGGTIFNSSTNYDVYNNDGSVKDEKGIVNKKNWEK